MCFCICMFVSLVMKERDSISAYVLCNIGIYFALAWSGSWICCHQMLIKVSISTSFVLVSLVFFFCSGLRGTSEGCVLSTTEFLLLCYRNLPQTSQRHIVIVPYSRTIHQLLLSNTVGDLEMGRRGKG